MRFTTEELDAVTRWLDDRRDWLSREGLLLESQTIAISRNTAREQLRELQDAETIAQ